MPTHARRTRFTAFILAPAFLVLLALLAGCGSYSLRGRVVAGANPMITLVPADDPSLDFGRAVTDAGITLVRDPQSLSRETVAEARSGPSGWFSMPVGAFGAGWMDEVWEVSANAPGFHGVTHILRLPGSGDDMVLLIILSEGMDLETGEQNLLEQFDRYR